MPKAIAFLSYGLNACLMLGVALFLAKNLTAAEYSRYSFAVATAQTLGVCVFEWVRLAAARHFPGPDPNEAPHLRCAFIGGQYVLGFCTLAGAFALAFATADLYVLLLACYAVSSGLVDLQFIMLRFDAQLALFSRLQSLRACCLFALVVSAAFLFRSGSASLLGAILANFLTVSVLGVVRPEFVFVIPCRRHIVILRQVASYGISAATAGGFYQAGFFFLRCAAFRGASETSYAAFSLVMDLMQRPYDLLLSAVNGVFFPDAVREHDRSPSTDSAALRLLYAIHAWCLLMIFGCAMAFRNEFMPMLVKAELLPGVLEVFPFLAAFYLANTAINYSCAAGWHLSRSGFQLIMLAVLEFSCIVIMTVLWAILFGFGIRSAAIGGMLGASIAFLLASCQPRIIPCQFPWASWVAAGLTTLPLLRIGQIDVENRIYGICIKALVACPIIMIGAFFCFAIPFGFIKSSNIRTWRIAWPSRSEL